jgi:2-oxoisovalerate dehydrogenase E2 component (dihydrolipoyl transacylase)
LSVTVELPHVGESVVEGTIGKWLKQPGESVKRYEPLVEIITDKVTMEVPSPVEGSLLRVLAQEGETLPMGAPIAEMEAADGQASGAPSSPPPEQPREQPATPAPAGTVGYLLKDVTPVGPTGGAAIEVAEPTHEEAPPPPATPKPAPVATSATPPPTVHSGEPEKPGAADGGARLSPAVRRLAREHSIDINQVEGTGLGGRITRDDVLKYLEQGPAASPAPATTPRAAESTPGSDEEHLPLTPVRRMIAAAMVRSATEIPHAWSTVEVDVSGLVALRSNVRDAFRQKEGVTLTYLPFVIRAVVEALRKFPTMNASWGGDKIILKKRVNLGIAVAAPTGLIVPVIHDADQLSVAGLAKSVADIGERARINKLTLTDVQGGTFTLNNTGALGSFVSGPIINYPQAGIITTETIQKRAVVRDDAIAIRSMMNLCLSFDHRINDGAEASGFLEAVKARLQSMGPDTSVY